MPARYRRTKWVIVAIAGGLTLVAIWYSEHILWAMTWPRGMEPIPVTMLTDERPPLEYVNCSIGSVRIRIPSSLLQSIVVVAGRCVAFEGDGSKMVVFLPRRCARRGTHSVAGGSIGLAERVQAFTPKNDGSGIRNAF